MGNTSRLPKLSDRDIFYYRRRNKNRIFEALTSFFEEEASRHGISKKDIADSLSRDPAVITRLLSTPSNVTPDTVSDFLLSLGAEMDYRIVRFNDRPTPNYVHPLIGKIIDRTAPPAIKDDRVGAPKAKFSPVINGTSNTVAFARS